MPSYSGGITYYTEEEAKKKWCPMARLPFHKYVGMQYAIGAAINRNEGSGSKCYASECMMWITDMTGESEYCRLTR